MTDNELQEKMDKLGKLMHQMEESERDFEHSHEKVYKMIEDMMAEIKDEVLKRGSSQKSQCLEVRWSKGKTTWNGKLLEGLALAHPEINAAKNVGKPTVSFLLPDDEGWDSGK